MAISEFCCTFAADKTLLSLDRAIKFVFFDFDNDVFKFISEYKETKTSFFPLGWVITVKSLFPFFKE